MKRFKIKFEDGDIVADKYEIVAYLGGGWEGEVYQAIELTTKIPCALKFFYPKRNKNNRVANKYARKLHKLSASPVTTQYYSLEILDYEGYELTCMVYEYIDGEMLSTFISRRPGKRLGVLEGLLLLYSLSKGIENLHQFDEYHGDLHLDNIIIKRKGVGFEFKLLDMYTWGDSKKANKDEDLFNLIHIFYEAIGGAKYYYKQPQEVKDIILGQKRSLILKKFKSASGLRQYIENIEWESAYRI